MNKFLLIILIAIALPSIAAARPYHSHGGVSFGVGYGGGYGYAPAYYEPVYPAPVYYAPPPPPVYVQQAPVIVEQVQPYDNYARPNDATRYDQGYCREYQRNVKINGRVQESYGTACQQPDGSWQTVN